MPETVELTSTSELSEAQLAKIKSLAKADLFFFAKGILGYDWLNKRIHGPICKLLENQDIHELLVVLPRGWQKSTLVSICYPLWRAVNDLNIRILLVQNTATNAEAKLKVIADHIKCNALFRQIFPEVLPSDVWRNGSFCLKRDRSNPESTFEAVGYTTSINGRHYDEVVEDDTVAPVADDMNELVALPGKEEIAKCIGFHNSLSSIIIDILKGRSIVVGTRWAEKDLISHIKATMGDDVTVYERACRETNGKADENGELTFPERFCEKTLRMHLKKWGVYMFSCLYMNKPIRSEDQVFQPSWFEYYDTHPLSLIITTTVDIANDPEDTKSSDPDYSVVMTAGKCLRTGRIYVLDYTRERCSTSRLIDIIFDHARKWRPVRVGIEAVAYQAQLVKWTREQQRKLGTYFLVEPIHHGKKAKYLRILGLQPFFQSRSIFLRKYMTDLIGELLAFPVGAHDDVIDALAMQIPLWALTKVVEVTTLPEDLNPMSFEAGAKSIKLDRDSKKGIFGDLLVETGRTIVDDLQFSLN